MPDDDSIPPAMDEVRNLTAAEYDRTYADGEPHQLPPDVLEYLNAIERGEEEPPPLPEQPRSAARGASADLALPYMPARAHGGSFTLPCHIRVIHSTEGPMSRGNARGLAGPNWFGGPAGTSAHDIFDPGEGVVMVPAGTIAYHVGPAGNGRTRGSEHCGKVANTRDQWLSADGLEMLTRSARYNAAAAKRDGVLPRWLTLTQLRNREPGFCTHNDVRLALGGTTHSDPGPNFPYDVYMQLVQQFYNGTTPAPEEISVSAEENIIKAINDGIGLLYRGDNRDSAAGDTHPDNLGQVRKDMAAGFKAINDRLDKLAAPSPPKGA